MKAGFGNKNNTEIGVLIKFKDYLYAGVKNSAEGCQLWRTKSIDKEWELVIDKGLGNKNNGWLMAATIFNDQLYFGTLELIKGCEIFRTSDGENWEVVVGGDSKTKNGFGTARNFYCWSLEVYDGYLYVGTHNYIGGGEIWRSKEGITWEPVVAYTSYLGAKLHGADYPRGFDSGVKNYRGGIRNMIVYNKELYVALTAEDKRFSITLPFIGKFLTFGQGILMCHPVRRFTSYGLDIFKYNSTTDKWTRVIGGLFRGNASSGFGDSTNEYPWSMIVHDNYLYVGTLRIDPIEFFVSKLKPLKRGIGVNIPVGGGELWRFDGSNWEQINEDGFGDKYNIGIRELIVYNNYLIGCTMNIKDGCEIWKYDLS